MIKIFLFLLFGTLLFGQIVGNVVIEKHPLEVGSWVSKYKESSKLLKKPLKNSLNHIPYNPNLEYATESDIWKYFLSSKATVNH